MHAKTYTQNVGLRWATGVKGDLLTSWSHPGTRLFSFALKRPAERGKEHYTPGTHCSAFQITTTSLTTVGPALFTRNASVPEDDYLSSEENE